MQFFPVSVGGFAKKLLDIVLPPQCLLCRAIIDIPGQLCSSCWKSLTFFDSAICHCCGVPFDFVPMPQMLCPACHGHHPSFDRTRAVLRYDDACQRLVTGLKFADRLEGAPAFGQWMTRVGRDLLDKADALVPVPLHRRRLFRRRYNQAAVLGFAIARAGDVAMIPDLLVRRRATRSQIGLSRRARARNVRGAFSVRAVHRDWLKGKRIALVDDVFTTGATVEACARVLKRAGAAAVDVLVLARVADPSVTDV